MMRRFQFFVSFFFYLLKSEDGKNVLIIVKWINYNIKSITMFNVSSKTTEMQQCMTIIFYFISRQVS